MNGILNGTRVLDFGRYIAGPYCAALLGDLGADVIRVEKREGSEDRFIQPSGAGGGEGTLFLQMNRNKRGITLDPMHPEGREVVKKLVRTADIVVANLPPQTLSAMGLDYESLCAEKPDIILTTVSAFGHGGPYSDRVGFDGIAQVMSGAAHLSGTPEAPVKSYAAWVDFGTASLTAFGTLAALLHRRETGKGQVVEGALLSTALAYFNLHLMEQDLLQSDRGAIGNRSPFAGPADTFQTRDGWIIAQVMGAPLFRRWVKMMDDPALGEDPRFADDTSRGENGEALSGIMGAWCAQRTTEEALAALADAKIPAGPVYTPQQALDDPHVNAMGFLKPVSYPGLDRPARIMETPVRFSGSAAEIRTRPPLLGEHTNEILVELGYNNDEIGRLREAGAL